MSLIPEFWWILLIYKSGNNPDGCTVSFGPLGNFVYNQIIILPKPVQNLPPPKKSDILKNSETKALTKNECQELRKSKKKWKTAIKSIWNYQMLYGIH